MDKTARLKLLKEIGQRHAERENILFTGIPISDTDVKEEVGTLDTFIEESRERRRSHGINSDE